jgi:hypothetical protein
MELKLRARKPSWFEKKWKPKKPILYLLETVEGKWVNTYWWEGNWKNKGRDIKFFNSGTVKLNSFFGRNRSLLVVGRSGTTLKVDGSTLAMEGAKIKSLNPMISEWTCFGKIDGLGIFTAEVSKFDLTEEIKKSLG